MDIFDRFQKRFPYRMMIVPFDSSTNVATSGAGTAYYFGVLMFTPVF